MGSKREEERNEKIIRGLMKLPPNRRCINCNSLGPQYVCTNFWTFVCMPCSGIHREFTHRVKSVSMAKFTSQEVDALQKGGNQRARELFLKAWEPLRHRYPDNSNVDKVREFIKHVYVDKKYAVDKSSDRPPKDPQSIKSPEDEMRRASSYHSYSQSPPYDFQYEERRYGKPVASLTRKHGSDRGLYEGRLSSFSSFSSPSRFSDHANDERFANEGSYPGVLSPSPQRETWSPFNETSSHFSSEIHGHHTVLHNSDATGGSHAGRIGVLQRAASSGTFGSFDSKSFKSVNPTGLQDPSAENKHSVEASHAKIPSFPSLPQSSTSTSFNGVDLFNEPFAPQNITSTPAAVCSSQSPESLLAQSVDLFQQSPISSIPTLMEQQPAQTTQPLQLNFPQPRQQQTSSNGRTSDVANPPNGGWATFDLSQNLPPVASQNSPPAVVPSSDGNNLGDFNPFLLGQSSFSQKSASHNPSASTHTLWHDEKNVEPTTNNIQSWNAFVDPPRDQPIANTNGSLNVGVFEVPINGANINAATYQIEPPSSSLSSHSSVLLQDLSVVPQMAEVCSVATVRSNPFDIPCDADLESSDMTQFWDMSSLQAVLPNNQIPAAYIADANESWFSQNLVPSYIPGGVAFDPPNAGPMGFVVAQAPSAQIAGVPAQGPVSGNPFA